VKLIEIAARLQHEALMNTTNVALKARLRSYAEALEELAREEDRNEQSAQVRSPRCPKCASAKLSCENGCTWEIK